MSYKFNDEGVEVVLMPCPKCAAGWHERKEYKDTGDVRIDVANKTLHWILLCPEKHRVAMVYDPYPDFSGGKPFVQIDVIAEENLPGHTVAAESFGLPRDSG